MDAIASNSFFSSLFISSWKAGAVLLCGKFVCVEKSSYFFHCADIDVTRKNMGGRD